MAGASIPGRRKGKMVVVPKAEGVGRVLSVKRTAIKDLPETLLRDFTNQEYLDLCNVAFSTKVIEFPTEAQLYAICEKLLISRPANVIQSAAWELQQAGRADLIFVVIHNNLEVLLDAQSRAENKWRQISNGSAMPSERVLATKMIRGRAIKFLVWILSLDLPCYAAAGLNRKKLLDAANAVYGTSPTRKDLKKVNNAVTLLGAVLADNNYAAALGQRTNAGASAGALSDDKHGEKLVKGPQANLHVAAGERLREPLPIIQYETSGDDVYLKDAQGVTSEINKAELKLLKQYVNNQAGDQFGMPLNPPPSAKDVCDECGYRYRKQVVRGGEPRRTRSQTAAIVITDKMSKLARSIRGGFSCDLEDVSKESYLRQLVELGPTEILGPGLRRLRFQLLKIEPHSTGATP